MELELWSWLKSHFTHEKEEKELSVVFPHPSPKRVFTNGSNSRINPMWTIDNEHRKTTWIPTGAHINDQSPSPTPTGSFYEDCLLVQLKIYKLPCNPWGLWGSDFMAPHLHARTHAPCPRDLCIPPLTDFLASEWWFDLPDHHVRTRLSKKALEVQSSACTAHDEGSDSWTRRPGCPLREEENIDVIEFSQLVLTWRVTYTVYVLLDYIFPFNSHLNDPFEPNVLLLHSGVNPVTDTLFRSRRESVTREEGKV